ncbi:MAG: ATP synthase F1 subunit gamma [Solirubrobacteraceae bacterium]
MPNLKEIRNRISSIDSTKQITNAMKMVSAAKLKKAQDAITEMRPYAQKLQELMQNIATTIEGDVCREYTEKREINNVLLVVLSSNKGLCGAYNSSVFKEVNKQLNAEYAGKKVTLLTIGKKATQYYRNNNTLDYNSLELVDKPTFKEIVNITNNILMLYLTKEIDKVVVVYNQFKNAGNQIVKSESILPVEINNSPIKRTASDYIFEPNKEEIILELIPKSIKMQLFKALLDSIASEHGARMTAMHKATDNAQELVNDLKLAYNKARQASITTEILEIIGGAAALDG